MAIDASSLLARLSPIAPINITPGGMGGGSMERERLRMMRQSFEFEKKQHADNQALEKLKVSEAMARQQLAGEQELAKIEAQKAADRLKLKQAGALEFSKLAGSGDIEGARAMVPYLASVGQGVELLDEEGGMPRFRMFDLDEQGNEAMPLEQKSGSTEDAFSKALYFSQHRGGPGATPAPGGFGIDADTYEALNEGQSINRLGPGLAPRVPDNVIDAPAIAASSAARLAPMLGNLIQAYPDASGPDPDAYRRSAESTARGVLGSGMPALKALDQFKSLRGGADAILQAQIAADAQQGRFEQQFEQRGKAQDQRLIAGGEDKARKTFADAGIKKSLAIIRISKQIEELLTNDDPLDDIQTATLITELSHAVGSQSDKDVARAIGMDVASTPDQIIAWIKKKAVGGFSRTQRNSLIGFAKSSREAEKKTTFEWLDSVDENIGKPDTDRNTGIGWERFRDGVVPKWLRDEHKAARDKARAETDATTGASPIPETARIAREHNNPGNLKYVEQDGATKGEAASDGGHWAKFETFEEGLEALKSQVQKDMKRGLTVEQFVTKYAPPGSNDTAKYIADAVSALGARANQKLSEIDVDKVVSFVAKKESGTDVSSKPATSSADADALDILNRSGY